MTQVGSTPDPAGDGAGDLARCWTLTPSTSGLHSVRIAEVDHARWQARLRVTDPDGALVVNEYFGEYSAPVPLVELQAGTAYRVEAVPEQGSPDARYRVAADDLVGSTCAPMPRQAWDAGLLDLPLADHRLECRTITSNRATTLWIEQTRTDYTGSLLLDEAGADACTYEDPEEPLRRCFVPPGSYRVIVGAAAQRTPGPVGLRALPVGTSAGCEQVALGAWGEPLPGSGERSGPGAVTCFSLTTPRGSAYDLRTWQDQADNPYNWVATYDLYDATTGHRIRSLPNVHDRTYASWVEIDEGHDLRLIAHGYTADPGPGYDPTYRVALIDRAETEGCSPLSTDWAGPVVDGRVEEGEVDCYQLDSPVGRVALIDARGPDAPPGTPSYGGGVLRPYVRVVDATGATVDDCESYAGRRSEARVLDCELRGTAPFRVLVHTDDDEPRTDYTIDVGDPAVGVGCLPLGLATWGRELPSTGLRPAGGSGSDCWTMTATEDGVQRASVWAATFDPTFAVYRADSRGLDQQFPVEAGATYRVIVGGDPGPVVTPYKLGLYDVTGDGSNGASPDTAPACTAVESAAVGAPELVGTVGRGIFDCYQLPEGPRVIRLELYGPDGPDDPFDAHYEDPVLRSARIVGPSGGEDCVTALTKRTSCWIDGAKRVLVTGRGETEAGYRAAAWDPYDRNECQSIEPVWSYGAAPLEVSVPAGGQALCLTLPEGERRFFGVVRAPDDIDYLLLDGGGTNWCLTPGRAWPTNGRACAPGTEFDPYVLVLLNRGTVDHDVRLMLRHPLPDPDSCPEAPLTDSGFAPMTGTLDGDLDSRCHTVLLADGDDIALDVSSDDGPPPNVFVFEPDGEGLCGAVADQPSPDEPRCTPYAGDGEPLPHTVLVVATPESEAGDYEVRLGCPDRRCDPPPVRFASPGSVPANVKVGRTVRIAPIPTEPPSARVTYYWASGGRIVSKGRRFVAQPEHRGRPANVVAVATAPGHAAATLVVKGPVVRPGTIVVRAAKRLLVRGKARPGRSLTVRPVRVDAPSQAKVRYRWLSDGRSVPGASTRRYRVQRTDRGVRLRVRVTLNAPGYRRETLTSTGRRVG